MAADAGHCSHPLHRSAACGHPPCPGSQCVKWGVGHLTPCLRSFPMHCFLPLPLFSELTGWGSSRRGLLPALRICRLLQQIIDGFGQHAPSPAARNSGPLPSFLSLFHCMYTSAHSHTQGGQNVPTGAICFFGPQACHYSRLLDQAVSSLCFVTGRKQGLWHMIAASPFPSNTLLALLQPILMNMRHGPTALEPHRLLSACTRRLLQTL